MQPQQPMSTQAVQGLDKLVNIIKPFMEVLKADLKDQSTLNSQEILLAIEALGTRIDILERLVEVKKSTATSPESRLAKREEREARKKDDVARADTPTTTTTTTTPGSSGVLLPKKTFAVNKLVFFREQYKTDASFREKYTPDEVSAAIAADPAIKAKANEQQRLIAQATFCWSYFKEHNHPLIGSIDDDYRAAKADFERAQRTNQLFADPRTPNSELA